MKATEMWEVALEACMEEINEVKAKVLEAAKLGKIGAEFESLRHVTRLQLRNEGYDVNLRKLADKKNWWVVEFV